MRISKTFRFVDPKQADEEDLQRYRDMTPAERVELQRQIREQWYGSAVRRIARTHRFVDDVTR
jgi:hypothetical protein